MVESLIENEKPTKIQEVSIMERAIKQNDKPKKTEIISKEFICYFYAIPSTHFLIFQQFP